MSRRRSAPISVSEAVARFVVVGLVAVILVGVGVSLILRKAGTSEAIKNAREQTQLAGKGIIEPMLTAGVTAQDPAALAQLDRIVRERVLGGSVVRVKVWRRDGTIVYSDEPRLIGSRYTLSPQDLGEFEGGKAEAEVSDLSRPENRFEREHGKLLEVYLPLHARDGSTVLYEQYLEFGSIAASARRIWLLFLPAWLVGLGILALIQIPLAVSLARRVRHGQIERETLLTRAIESSDLERRRIAADLHDGVVQDLAGLSYELAAAAERSDGDDASAFRKAAREARRSVRSLRSLLPQIYPPSLSQSGLEAALSDVLASATARGLEAQLDVEDEARLGPEVQALLFRTAQEAIRNVVKHAGASTVAVSVSAPDETATLIVADDGQGFTPGRAAEGHLGLALVADLVEKAGGTLTVESAPDTGTRLRVEVPRT